jgi:trans-feruloyl-CoA hydratase/vanillin synthase
MSDFTYENVLVEIKDQVAWVTLNRPEKRNAMSPALCYDMVDVLTRLAGDDDVRVLVLTGAGEAFSAGMDLKLFFRALDDNPAEKARAREADRAWNWQKLSTFPKPTIAMVNGYCFGGAFTPLVACDIAIAAEDATFGLSEVNWGILPGGLVSKVVTMTMNYRQSLYYAMTGKPFDGRKAAEVGLVTFAVPREKLRDEVASLAEDLKKIAPEVLRGTKETIRSIGDMPVDMAFDFAYAKSDQLRFRDREQTRARGMEEFLDTKSYRPGLGPVKRS